MDPAKGVRPHGLALIDDVKTKSGRRTLALPKFAQDALRTQQVRQALERRANADRWKHSALVFSSTIGTPLDDRNVQATLGHSQISVTMDTTATSATAFRRKPPRR
ncbi:MAG: hypothetical protein GEV06_06560 [Luteitalea sp.]|nr:hypothetical protein [Luteitalea sp.]